MSRADFASRLRHAVQRSGYQKSFIAGQLGVNPRTLSRWLSGESVPRAERELMGLSRVLGVSVGWLEGTEEAKPVVQAVPDNHHALVLALIDRAQALLKEAAALLD